MDDVLEVRLIGVRNVFCGCTWCAPWQYLHVGVEALVGQPILKCGQVLEERFPSQRLVPALLAGDVRGGMDAVRSGD